MTPRRLALLLAALTSATLVVMLAITLATGATQEAHEWYQLPADYAAGLLARPGALRLLFGVDVAFLVLYTAFFAALREYLRALGRPFVTLALAVMVFTALLDIIEDHHILAALGMAEHGQLVSSGSIALQQVISQTKFSASYLGLTLFALAIPRTRRLGLVVALFLSVGVLVTGVIGIAAPPEWRAQLDAGRWYGFLAGFVLAGLWLRSAPEPAPAN